MGRRFFNRRLILQFEDQVMKLYHQSMDERQGGSGGHSQTGRRLLSALVGAQ